jgi:hypothetical protein
MVQVLLKFFPLAKAVDCIWNVMAHAHKPDFVFRRNGRVHLNRRGRQFSRLLAPEVCASAVVMLDTPCYEVVWRVLATHSILQFPLHFPSRVSPCAIIFQLESTSCAEIFPTGKSSRLRLKCDGTRAETRFRLSAKRMSPFKSVGASVQSTTGSRGVRISGSNVGYTRFRGSMKSTGYPPNSPVSPSLPCVTVCHHISTGDYKLCWNFFPLAKAVPFVIRGNHKTCSDLSQASLPRHSKESYLSPV